MKKLMNDPAAYVDESLDGLCAAFAGYQRTCRADDHASARQVQRKARSAS